MISGPSSAFSQVMLPASVTTLGAAAGAAAAAVAVSAAGARGGCPWGCIYNGSAGRSACLHTAYGYGHGSRLGPTPTTNDDTLDDFPLAPLSATQPTNHTSPGIRPWW